MKKKNIPSLIVLGLLGLLLVVWPGATLTLVCRLAAIALLLVAATGIYTWWKEKSTKPAGLGRLLGSVAALAVGLWILFNTAAFEKLIPTVLGIVMIVFGATELYKAFKGGKNPVTMALAGVAIVLGLIVAFNPFSAIKVTIVCAGIALIYTAVTGIFNELKLGK
ncbi:MAG: DUF308 domain-containing protein [Clostridia bacterium]|nr:DUF308 domain-containing protein [Clostridia bacterium]MBO4885769.1 DUF308 domain-containing protein [Clostridia bacterium]MBR4443106.1 DUF308 domain-containing protein [Clostridia bacterium]